MRAGGWPMADTASGLGSGIAPDDYAAAVRAAERDPRRLEELYGAARRAGEASRFAAAVEAAYGAAPANLLYAAWHERLRAPAEEHASPHWASWRVAIPLSLLLGVALWALSDPHWIVALGIPYLALLWAPIVAVAIVAFLALATLAHRVRAALAIVALAVLTAAVLAIGLSANATARENYFTQM